MARRAFHPTNYVDYAKNQYVDVFGRLITTFEDDSGQVLVPLVELKTSGFELFLRDAVPQAHNKHLDSMQMKQFDLYLRMKAAKFLGRINKVVLPEEEDALVEKQMVHFQVNKERSVKPSPLKITIDNVLKSPPFSQQTNGNHQVGERITFERSKTSVDFNPRSRPGTNQGFDSRHSHPGNDRQQSQNVDRRSENRNFSGRQSNNSNDRNFNSGQYDGNNNQSFNRPRNSGQDFNSITFNANVKEHSPRPTTNQYNKPGYVKPCIRTSNESLGSANHNVPQKTVAFENHTSPKQRNSESNGGDLGVNYNSPSPQTIKAAQPTPPPVQRIATTDSLAITDSPTTHLRRPQLSNLQSSTTANVAIAETAAAKSVDREVLQTTNNAIAAPSPKPQQNTQPPVVIRKAAVDCISASGTFELTDIIDCNTMLGCAFPIEYSQELCDLETITDDSVKDPKFVPKLRETVAVLHKDDQYVRGTVINIVGNQYTCALLDYGSIITSKDVRALAEKYHAIPEFACVCSGDDMDKIAQGSVDYIKIDKPNTVSFKLSDSDNLCVLKAERWDPFKQLAPPEKEIIKVYKVVPQVHKLKSGDLVLIARQIDSNLFVRTRKCVNLLKQVENELKSYEGQQCIGNVEINQLCVYADEKTPCHRVQVLEIKANIAIITFIDYGTVLTVPLTDLYTISKSLAEYGNTLFKIALNGFVGATFSAKAVNVIRACLDQKEKFTAVAKEGDDVYDLISVSDKSSFSEKLKALDAELPSESRTLFHLLNHGIVLNGINEMMCTYPNDLENGVVAFCGVETIELFGELATKILTLIQEDQTPYAPQIGELCVAQEDGEWFRAVVTNFDKHDQRYTVTFVDYGNSTELFFTDIRKISKNVADFPRVAAFCTLEGVTKNGDVVTEPLLSRLKDLVKEGEAYEIDVIRKRDDGLFVIRIPKVYDLLKSENLLNE